MMWIYNKTMDRERRIVEKFEHKGHQYELHRVIDAGGVPYSVIYEDGVELLSCARSEEVAMLAVLRNMIG